MLVLFAMAALGPGRFDFGYGNCIMISSGLAELSTNID